MDAFEGWYFGSDLLSEGYREVIQAPVVEVRPPTTGQFSVQNLLRQRQPLQPQLLQQQLPQQQQQHQLLQQGNVMGAQMQQIGIGLPLQQLLQQQAFQQQQHALQQQFAQGFAPHHH
jgi:hypothetical protein